MKCATHVDVDASGFCRNCGKPLCHECARDVRGALYCEDCLAGALTGTAPSTIPPPRTNAGAAAALGLIPGLGAVYNGDYTRALIHVGIWAGLLAVGLTGAFGDLTALGWIAFGLFPIYTSLDSYRAAHSRKLAAADGEDPGAVATSRPVGAIVLIVLGVLALLGNLGWIRGEVVDKGWPLVLIAIGVWLYVKRSRAS